MPDELDNLLAETAAAPAAEVTADTSEFESLLSKEFKPKSDDARSAVQIAVRTLAEQALAGTALIGRDAVASIQAIIAELDRKLTEQVNLIIHHPDFQKLEGSWRSLYHWMNTTETDEKLKIRVMNLSKKEAGRV